MKNIAEILKNCPKGTKLYSPIFGDVELIKVSNMSIIVRSEGGQLPDFYVDGKYHSNGECMLFPSKENRDWNKFSPFKDGDVVVCMEDIDEHEKEFTQAFILKCIESKKEGYCYIGYDFRLNKVFKAGKWCFDRLATEEEKQKLFDAIKANGYKWNAETKTLEKLIVPKFKVGDRITNGKVTITIEYIDDRYYYAIGRKITSRLYINEQDNWQLVKFDINTLKPFDKVLVRDSNDEYWNIGFFSFQGDKHFCTARGYYAQCIPYEENKHLLGTTNNCDEYFKTW